MQVKPPVPKKCPSGVAKNKQYANTGVILTLPMVHAMELLERKSDSPAGEYGVVAVGHDALIFPVALVTHHVHSVIDIKSGFLPICQRVVGVDQKRPNLSVPGINARKSIASMHNANTRTQSVMESLSLAAACICFRYMSHTVPSHKTTEYVCVHHVGIVNVRGWCPPQRPYFVR